MQLWRRASHRPSLAAGMAAPQLRAPSRSAAAFNHLAVKLPPLPPPLTAGVKQGFPALVYSPCNRFGYLYCTHHRALRCMKWAQLYLYQCKNKVIINRGGDIQSIFSLLCDAVSSAIQAFIRQSHTPRKKTQPTLSQESHSCLPAPSFLTCVK